MSTRRGLSENRKFGGIATFLLTLALLAVAWAVAPAHAEDGYDLWLRYRPVERPPAGHAVTQLAAENSSGSPSPTLDAARRELTMGLAGLLGQPIPEVRQATQAGALVIGTPADSPVIAGLKLDLSGVGREGYVIRTVSLSGRPATVIAANDDVGVLHGAFHFLRLVQTRTPLESLAISSTPALQLRVLDHWDNLDGTVERGYAGASIWDWHKLPDYIDPRYERYARACASVGLNGTVLTNVNANAVVLQPAYIAKAAAIAGALRPYGIRVYLSARFSAPIEIGGLKTADPLDPQVQAWWRAKADEIYRAIPDFGGFVVKANSEGQPGPQDYKRSHADGANMLAAAVAPHGGVIMWRAFVYSNEQPDDRAKQAYSEFVPLDGKFRENVLLQVKNGPIDFQPREPFHPLFGAMPKTPLMMEFQLTKEYLGFATHLVYLAPLFQETLASDTGVKGKGSTVAKVLDGSLQGYRRTGIAAVSNVGADRNWTGSQFDQANWYAVGRLAWNPAEDPAVLADEWVRMTFSNDDRFVKPVVQMMIASREAVVDYMTPLGLHHQMGRGFHYGPGPWVTGGPRADWTSVYFHRADAMGIGFDRSATGSNAVAQYSPMLAKQFGNIDTVPEKYLLWFHHVPWDHRMASGRTLWDELVARYTRGVETVAGMRKTWAAMAPYVDAERHKEVATFLAIQEKEARWWRDACIAYFQTFSKRPIPAGFAPPERTLAEYQAIQVPYAPGSPPANPPHVESPQPPAAEDHQRMLDALNIKTLRVAGVPNYDEARANPYPKLPDPLVLKNGKPVKTADAWWNSRRAEIVEDFDREVYGRVPASLPNVRWEVISTKQEKVGATTVVTKQLLGRVDNSAYPQVSVDIELSVTTPARATGPVPVVMELYFPPRPGAQAPQSEDGREQVLAKGWGFARLTPTSIQPDNGDGLARGIIGLASKGRPRKPDDWGALRAWAWGASRALDYLETDRAVDATRVAIEGLSRYGKAALVAMAYEPRFAVGFIGSSGAGGAKLHRRDFGERVENLAAPSEYHWMAGNYLKYAGPLTPQDLPVDAHELIALAAPRPLFIGSGSQEIEGGWIDARGMFMAAAAAGPVYRLLGRKDLGTTTFPPQETPLVAGELAFRQHSGGHTNGPNWATFLSFADRYFSGRPLLSSVFRDHAVLQRDQPIRIWGWTVPGDRVDVSLAGNSASARADASGKWLATLPPIRAGGPHSLSVRTATGATARSNDILIGDVWLCSGQSNMVLPVNRTLDSRSEIARAANDSIRMLTLELVSEPTPQADVASVQPWLAASSSNVPEFSAACFYFARELQKTVNVPMGLINSSWGGSRLQAWMSAESLRTLGGNDTTLELLKLNARDPIASLHRWDELWQSWWKTHGGDRASAEPWSASPDVSKNWSVVPKPTSAWEEWGVADLESYNGIVWYRTEVTLDAKQAGQGATLELGPVDEIDTTWVNGKTVGYTSGAGTNRSYPLLAGTLHAGVNTIAVSALDTYATGGMLGTESQRKLTFADGSSVPIKSEWKYRIAPSDMGPPPRAPWESTGGTTTIYNAMIAPLEPYTLRGVAWYQGESNTEDAASYAKLMTAWMADWRKRFVAPELPFLIVQLANYGPAATAPSDSGWAQLREAQRSSVAKDAHAALALTIDIGDRYDIHPANKQELGRRLARAARNVVYGENLAPSGPVAKSASHNGKQIVVQFEDVEGSLVTYGNSRAIGFELCGKSASSCQFVEGTANGRSVQIEVPDGASTTRVRYAWADSPICNLFDQAGLPAGPFELEIRQ